MSPRRRKSRAPDRQRVEPSLFGGELPALVIDTGEHARLLPDPGPGSGAGGGLHPDRGLDRARHPARPGFVEDWREPHDAAGRFPPAPAFDRFDPRESSGVGAIDDTADTVHSLDRAILDAPTDGVERGFGTRVFDRLGSGDDPGEDFDDDLEDEPGQTLARAATVGMDHRFDIDLEDIAAIDEPGPAFFHGDDPEFDDESQGHSLSGDDGDPEQEGGEERVGHVPRAAGAEGGRRLAAFLASGLLVILAVAVAVDQLLNPAKFPLKNIEIRGVFNNVDPQTVDLAVRSVVEKNYFAVDLAEVESTTAALPWVDDVDVQRQWPDTLIITVTEQRPLARFGPSRYLNQRGEIIDLPPGQAPPDLPGLDGPDAAARDLLAFHSEWQPRFRGRGLDLRSVDLTERNAYTLEFLPMGPAPGNMTPVVLLVGRSEVETRLERFLEVYPQELAADIARVAAVDLRYPNGLAVSWLEQSPHDVAAERPAAATDDGA